MSAGAGREEAETRQGGADLKNGSSNPASKTGSAASIATLYAVFGGLWIAASDRVIEALVPDPHRLTLLQTYKGWAFVAASTILLYVSVRRALRRREHAEDALRKSELLYRTLAESAPEVIMTVGRDECVQYINAAGARFLGRPQEEIVGKHLKSVCPPEICEKNLRNVGAVFASGEAVSFEGRSGEQWVDTLLAPVRDSEGDVAAVLSVSRDITERKQADARLDRQVKRLSALHTVDEAITASLDLKLTLDVLLSHVTNELGVDAADVLLLNPHSLMLEYAAGRGFHSQAVSESGVKLGEGYAGRAALERRMVFIPDLSEASGDLLRFPFLKDEGFVAYHGTPLVAKGHVKGVLEIFHRSTLETNHDWLGFLDALATQAAIAIDNAALFDNLERSNTELVLAYDATLEGWGRALELRDEETEGHTQRVTEMTLLLARAMGIGEQDLVHVRRGSFLHDIGKIGIPDRVLLKAGPLTEEEWEIMRRHPVYAFRMLQPIRFLRAALDIPYCHHEKWDGTGYPRGLKGEQIPLPARIFAVVDVWDALVSGRPYHVAGSKETVREHIRSLSGTHFDPKVVDVFLGMSW